MESRINAGGGGGATSGSSTTEARVERTELMEFSDDSIPSTSMQKELPPASGIGRWRLPHGESQQGTAGGIQVVDVDESERPSDVVTINNRAEEEAASKGGPKWRRTSIEMGLLEKKDAEGTQRVRPPPVALTFTGDEVQEMEQQQRQPDASSSGRSHASASHSQEGSQRKHSILKGASSKRGSVEWKMDDPRAQALRSDPTLLVPEEASTSQQFSKPPSFSKGSFRSKSSRASFILPENAPALLPPNAALEPYPPKDSPSQEQPTEAFVQGRNRRQSFLDYFKSGAPSASGQEARPSNRELNRQPSAEELRASFGKSKSATRSFIDMFRSRGGQEEGQEDVPPVARSRGSVIDMFRSKGAEETEDLPPAAAGRSKSRQSMIDLVAPRRGSVLDIFSSGPKMPRSNSMEATNRRRSSMMQRLLSFGKEGKDGQDDLLAAYEDPVWFTSLEDFRALTHRYHQTKFMDSYFACAIKTGQHHVLKMYHKEKMEPSDVQNLQRVLEFAKWLDHPHMVKVLGTWETEEAFYIVEEYVIRGDILQDSMSYPERYTEKFLVQKIIQPLLSVLVYLHEQQIMHRSIIPEHLLLGRDDKFVLGHFVKAVNYSIVKAKDRVGMLDYMPPEMIAVKDEAVETSFPFPAQLLTEDSPFGAMAIAPRGQSSSGRPASNSIMVPHNSWEWQASYDEKVDIWQVGCVVHEILCGCLPFETDNHPLTAALILWADVNFWPETLSPECISFLKACLQKNPELRPSAEELLKHPWIIKTMAGEGGEAGLLTVAQLRDAELAAQKPSGSMKGGLSGRGSQTLTSNESTHSGSERGGWFSGLFGGGSQNLSRSSTREEA